MTNRTVAILAITSLLSFAATPAPKRGLSFEERVDAQRAIERVYHSHQVGTKRSFEEAVPRSVLEKKVETYLKQSVALEKFWHTPVTAEMLQRESDRIARGTRMTDRLQELYAALGYDSFLFQETVARPALVDRLTRSFFESDQRIHGESRSAADSLHRLMREGALGSSIGSARRTVTEFVLDPGNRHALEDHPTIRRPEIRGTESVRLTTEEFSGLRSRMPGRVGEIGPLREGRDDFSVSVLLEEEAGRLRIASYVVPKRSWEDWWAEVSESLDGKSVSAVASENGTLPRPSSSGAAWSLNAVSSGDSSIGPESASSCAPDTWNSGSLGDLPDPRSGHHAVWTGSLMLIWGGSQLNRGARYDPVIDWWTAISSADAPSNRDRFTTVWTGSRMVVWGGIEPNTSQGFLQSGGQYDPVSDTWNPTSTINAPVPRAGHAAVWTGTEMVVWGGSKVGSQIPVTTNTGGRYNPATDTWVPTSTTNAPLNPYLIMAVWADSRMIVWGYYGGGKYDPATDSWTSVSNLGAPMGRSAESAVWTGSEMIIWGGSESSASETNTGARYDPDTDTWSPTPTSGAPPATAGHTAIWTGTRMIVWGGGFNVHNTGGAYDPVSDTWSLTSLVGAPSGRIGHTAVWTGSQMIVWGGDFGGLLRNTGGRYDPASDSWTPTSTNGAPQARSFHSAVWTGSQMIVWGGYDFDGDFVYLNTGSRYNPITDSWTATSTTEAPEGRLAHTVVWTGDEMVVWGGSIQGALSSGGRYNPVTDQWSPISNTNAPERRFNASGVWTGSRMVVWGGANESEVFYDTGGVYDPQRDRWTATSLVNAPSPRDRHAAVWTGSEMIVWGGESGTWNFVDSGARYDPVSDSWSPTSSTGAPPGLFGPSLLTGPSAVWTGSRMIVSGFTFGNPTPVLQGGQYDPATDAWTPISTTGALAALQAVWTGQEMIVWGTGWYDGPAGLGARYDPVGDTWTPTSTAEAPMNRRGHTAIWTGDEMIVWGGDVNHTLNTGGRYRPAAGDLSISLSVQPSTIAVANHKLVDVVATVIASSCAGTPTTVLTSITSSEPDDAPGPSDGHTINDIQGASLGTADFEFQVRAEANLNGSGRTYTIVYTASDSLGHQSIATGHVFVAVKRHKPVSPLDGKRRKRSLD